MATVKIVVENGMVSEVYSDDENIGIEVIDMDTDEEDVDKENKKRYDKLVKSKKFSKVY